MKKNILLSFASIALAAGIIFTQTSVAWAESKYYVDTPSDHPSVKYSDMDLSGIYSYEGTLVCIKELEESIKKQNNDEEVKALFEEMLGLTDIAVTHRAITNNEYYKNIDDTTIANLYSVMEDQIVAIDDYASNVVSQMMETEYAYIVEDAFSKEDAESFIDHNLNTPEENELISKRQDLVMQYESLIGDIDMDMSDQDYEEVANIFIQIVEINKRIAEIEGKDSFAEYMYEAYYRDYTPEEASIFKKEIKENVPKLLDQINDRINGHYDKYYEYVTKAGPTSGEILEIMRTYLPQVDEELMPAYNQMIEDDLIYLQELGNGMDMGYTTRLSHYGVPYILNNINGVNDDVTDTVHEFGHFNSMYHVPEYAINGGNCLDVSEIQSQGLELLFLKYSQEIYGEDYAEVAVYTALYKMLSAIVDGCVQDEFQQRAYETDSLTPEILEDIYSQVIKEYGEEYVDGKDWIFVTHTFQQPFYYLSYATSAVGALEIFTLSLDDRDRAVDAYMKITALEGYQTLKDATDIIGEGNIMEAGTVSKMCAALSAKTESGEIITQCVGEKYLTPDEQTSAGTILREAIDELSQEEGMDMNAAETMIFIYVVGAIIGILMTTTIVFLALTIIFTTKNRNKNKLIAKYRAALAAQHQDENVDNSKIAGE